MVRVDHRRLDVRVTHERLDIDQRERLDRQLAEGVAQIVEAHVLEAGAFERGVVAAP
ncbi:MAG: hypothetical protein H0W09_06905 [Solirubrobacterales bacterium]|nr:hypothetical protein [Solirubrobacterales bacterium]